MAEPLAVLSLAEGKALLEKVCGGLRIRQAQLSAAYETGAIARVRGLFRLSPFTDEARSDAWEAGFDAADEIWQRVQTVELDA